MEQEEIVSLITRSDDERLRDSYWMLVNPFKATPEDMGDLYRDSLRAALAAKEKAEGALCSMREALQHVAARGHQHWCPTVKNSLPEKYCECHLLVINPALSSSSPCPGR